MFDVADTGRTERGRSPYLWELREEHKDSVSAMLETRYDVDGADGLADQLERMPHSLRTNIGTTTKGISSPSLTILTSMDMMNTTWAAFAMPQPSASPIRSCPDADLTRMTTLNTRTS